MLMVCPQCKGSFDGVLQCPKCGVRLMLATEKEQPVAQGSKQGKWHQTPSGRILAGLVLGSGLIGSGLACGIVLPMQGSGQQP